MNNRLSMAAQIPDRIIYNQAYYNLCTNPLELYWVSKGKKRPKFTASDVCVRGYVAPWELRDNQLLLREVQGQIRKRFTLWGDGVVQGSVARLFGRKKVLVKATWYSGKLRIPAGSMTMFEDNGYDSRYEKEVIITIDHGNVTKVVTLDYRNQSLKVNFEGRGEEQ